MEGKNFSESGLFEYNGLRKYLLGLLQIIGLSLIGLMIVLYFIFFKDMALFNFFEGIISSIYNEITSSSLLGVVYASFVGGLFFVFLPLEVLFGVFIRNNNPWAVFFIFLFGLCVSYGADYFIGLKFGKFVKHLIGAEKFYETKGILNKYGKFAIFFFNVLPLPSQQLAAILGVFKYNKARFYTFFLIGQVTKLLVIMLMMGKLF